MVYRAGGGERNRKWERCRGGKKECPRACRFRDTTGVVAVGPCVAVEVLAGVNRVEGGKHNPVYTRAFSMCNTQGRKCYIEVEIDVPPRPSSPCNTQRKKMGTRESRGKEEGRVRNTLVRNRKKEGDFTPHAENRCSCARSLRAKPVGLTARPRPPWTHRGQPVPSC